MVRPTFSSLGRFYIADSVVAQIVQHAVKEIPGIAGASKVTVDTRPEGVVIMAELTFHFGVKLVPLMREAQAHATRVVEALTALNVISLEIVAKKVLPPGIQRTPPR